jgi:aspartate beta-hydroxylase
MTGTMEGEPMSTPEELLVRAGTLEACGRDGEALLAYFRAIVESQRQGRWLDRPTTPPELLARVTHAMRFVESGRRHCFDQVLQPVYVRHGREALTRFEPCLAMQVGKHRAQPPDPRQRPSVLYFPGLPSSPYYERSAFPWFVDLERETGAIRNELFAVMRESGLSERVFGSDAAERLGLAGSGDAPSWNGFYFWRHGRRRDDNCSACPRTSALLDQLPLIRIREHAPEVMFSVLTPGTHILPHRGVTNTRVVCHLPLVVPEECALVVGGQRHVWREGEAVAFDDTYEHEAWNRGLRTRVVLIIDVWNPFLTAAEREAVAALVEAMGDFNRAAGV